MASNTLILAGPYGVLARFSAPPPDDESGWAGVVAAMNAAAYHHSAALRRAGTQGVIESFFDEMFNHLDPYSRYVAPAAAAADRDWRNGSAGIGVALAGRRGDIRLGKVVAQGPADLTDYGSDEQFLLREEPDRPPETRCDDTESGNVEVAAVIGGDDDRALPGDVLLAGHREASVGEHGGPE
jgi:carboxyl-terminal processing protease